MNRKRQWAVVIGRFQPFHIGHESIFDEIIADGFESVIVILGEQKDNGKNPLHFIHRANFLKGYLEKRFKHYAITPGYDFESNDLWLEDLTSRMKSVVQPYDYITFYVPVKKEDYSAYGDGTIHHWVEWIENAGWKVKRLEPCVGAEDVSATAIRNHPEMMAWAMCEESRFFMEENIHGAPPEFKFLLDQKWMRVKETSFKGERNSYLYSSRRNQDSIAFVFKFRDNYGFIIEQKPPIGDRRCPSAFGGSFDTEKDDIYKRVREESWEEAGFVMTDIEEIIYKGSYLATTQSDEVVHLFLVEVNNMDFKPKTTDPGEMKNTPIWVHESMTHVVDDWKAQMILR